MKISVLIAQYLYEQKILELPGIGTFKMDKSPLAVESHGSKDQTPTNILFEHKKSVKLPQALVDYVKEKTGKLRPLAEADIHSYLDDVTSYLNLGKAYYIEGIGTLNHMMDGSLEFSVGTPITEKIESKPINDIEEKAKDLSTTSSPIQIPVKPILVGIIILIGLAATWWLVEWVLSSRSKTPPEPVMAEAPVVVVDTAAIRRDSIALAIAKEKEGKLKFVFEETNRKTRALRRFAQVNELSPKIQMETSDSITFKIYVVLPSIGNDSTRIKDSLNAWYYGTLPNKIKIENP